MHYANLNNAIINNLLIKKSDLSECSFYEVQIKNIEFQEVKLFHTEFLRTKLEGVDFTDSDLNGVTFDNYSMKGIKVNMLECRYLVSNLGVEVVD